ncbi:hypothetical protein, conserved in T. vivax [Trypanosoma vivax Y486]|uniref:Uncharacterized protein n=1 Tax=Trypanosoma vivax (strain Y486) TaxID=1055687 RepID=F9WN14_TRYVY|nr:hypothetical protein, conserved in T. vivax [Trypanosoma vivax Y486]|eukprot:CCD18928.1 hypothetical protein, conserved in T. vivax [Trypanosoma vivax Y486]
MGPSTARASAVSASTAATPLTRLRSAPGPKAAGRCLQRHAVAGCRPCGVRRGAVRCTAFAQSEGMGICRRSRRVASSGEGTNFADTRLRLGTRVRGKGDAHGTSACLLSRACLRRVLGDGTSRAGRRDRAEDVHLDCNAARPRAARGDRGEGSGKATRQRFGQRGTLRGGRAQLHRGDGTALQEACALQALVEAAKAPLQKAHGNAVDAAATLHRGAGMATEYISVLASFAGGGSDPGKACLLSTKTITTPGSNPSIQATLDAITDTHNGNAKTCSNLFKHKDGPEALTKLLARAKRLKSTEKLENHDGNSGYTATNANIGGAYAGSNTCPLLGHTSSNNAGINAADGQTATFGAHFTIKVSSSTAGQLDATHTAKYYQDEDSPKTIADIAEAIEEAAKHTDHVDENGACDGPMQEVCNGTQKVTHILRAEMKEREASAARRTSLAKSTDKKDTSHKSAIQQGTDTRQDASEQDGKTAASREEGQKAEASAPRANLAHNTRKGWVALAFAAAPPAAR